MKFIHTCLILLICKSACFAGLLINEAVTNEDSDWVELKFNGSSGESIEISNLYVTMYYGSNEPLAESAVTLYSEDRPGTPYDDRFVVVHIADPSGVDETDAAGDVNGNGVRDLYCDNYYNSLWNSDGVIAIDNDDDPGNGGIVDFVAYSNRDGSPNSTIEGYVDDAADNGAWNCQGASGMQECSVDIGPDGLDSGVSMARKPGADTNTLDDFLITRYLTPGSDNIINVKVRGNHIFKPLKRKIAFSRASFRSRDCSLPLFVYKECNIRLKIFSLTGIPVYTSSTMKSVSPGRFSCPLYKELRKSRVKKGLYLCQIEGSVSSPKKSATEIVYIVVAGK